MLTTTILTAFLTLVVIVVAAALVFLFQKLGNKPMVLTMPHLIGIVIAMFSALIFLLSWYGARDFK